MTAQTLYEKALRSYLLRKYTSASNTCLKSIKALSEQDQPDDLLRINIWTLYLNITSTLLETTPFLGINIKSLGIDHAGSLEEFCRAVWSKVVNEGFGGTAFVDSRIVAACLVMYLKSNQLNVAKEITEEWLAALPDTFLDQVNAGNNQQQAADYISVLDIYIIRILPGLGDFESAETFIEYNSVLTQDKKKSLLKTLNDQKEAAENERQQKQRQQEEARLAAEEKRREIERQQIEEARQLEEEKKQKMKEQEEEEEEKEKVKENEEIKTVTTQPSITQSSPSSSSRSVVNTTNKVQHWINQFKTQNMTTSGAVLILLFALFALLRGQRGRLSNALQGFLNKLWQTVKMGTKVTYM